MAHFLTTQIPGIRNPITYSNTPAAQVPFFTSSTISQPVGTLPRLIPKVIDAELIFKAPPAPVGAVSWMSNSISQPLFLPYNQQLIGVPPVNPASYFASAPLAEAAWLAKPISQPYFTPYNESLYVWPPDISTYSKPPPSNFVSRSTISQPVKIIQYQIPKVFQTATYSKPPVPIIPIDSWLPKTISQPYFDRYDINLSIYRTYPELIFNPPVVFFPFAEWMSLSIAQPYFTPWDVNIYGTQPVNVGTYSKTPIPLSPIAEWLSRSISQPYFTPYDVNSIVWNPNAGNLRQVPASIASFASWLNDSISEPYITPYDVNQIVWNANAALLLTLAVAPQDYASWASSSISQPLFLPYNELFIGIPPVDPGLYFNTPVVTTTPFFTSSTISQPTGSIVAPIPKIVDASTLLTMTPPSTSLPWLSQSIHKPFFTPLDINLIVWNANAGYLRAITVSLPTGIASLLSKSISQPYFTPYDVNKFIYPPDIITYAKAPDGITITGTIEQPVVEVNYLIPGTMGVLRKFVVVAPTGVASWLQSTISKPIFLPVPTHILAPPFLFQKVTLYDWKKIPKTSDIWTKIPKPQF